MRGIHHCRGEFNEVTSSKQGSRYAHRTVGIGTQRHLRRRPTLGIEKGAFRLKTAHTLEDLEVDPLAGHCPPGRIGHCYYQGLSQRLTRKAVLVAPGKPHQTHSLRAL